MARQQVNGQESQQFDRHQCGHSPQTAGAGGKANLFLLVILALYAFLSLYQIDLPGLHYDEAFEAVPAMQLLRHLPVTAFRNSGIQLGDHLFPLMTQDYIGAVNTYIAIPFIALFGATTAALRIMSILIGMATIWLTYSLCYALTGSRPVGLAAALLLAVDPTFIFWNRQGVFVTAVTATLGVAATFCWLRRWQTGATRWSMAGAFLFGLGLYAKFLFLWLIAALVGAVLILNLSQIINSRTTAVRILRIQKAEILWGGAAFLLGCWPLIAYNVQTMGTFLNITENAATSYYGVNNLAFGPNLLERIGQFVTVLHGSHLWYLGDIITNPLSSLLFGLALLIVIVLLAMRKHIDTPNHPEKSSLPRPTPQKVVLFPFLVIGLVICFSVGTVSALWLTHFAILMPWSAIALSISGWYIHSALRSFRFQNSTIKPTVLVWVCLGLLATTSLFNVIRYHRVLTVSGGLSSHSNAVYHLSSWLADRAPAQVVAMDWGLAAPVTYLSNGRVAPIEIFGYAWQPNSDLAARLDSFINQPASLYLWRAPDEIIFDRSQEFKSLYRPLNLEENIEAAFYERSGRPLLGVTRLVEKGSAENPPQ